MYKRGGIYEVNLAHDGGVCPDTCLCLVISNNISNEFSPVVTIIPLSPVTREMLYEFETLLPSAKSGLTSDARLSSHIILTIDKARIVGERVGFLGKSFMHQVEKTLRLQLAL